MNARKEFLPEESMVVICPECFIILIPTEGNPVIFIIIYIPIRINCKNGESGIIGKNDTQELLHGCKGDDEM